MATVTLRTPIRATEDPERVAAAATQFLNGTIEKRPGELLVTATNLDDLRACIWELRIIDTVRSALLGGCDGKTMRFRLSKQAAAAGKVAIPVSHHPLGDLEFKVVIGENDPWVDAEALAWWICPETLDGEIVKP